MDTSLPGNHNSGHEFRNLRLEEIEAINGIRWDEKATSEQRWARVLNVSDDQVQDLNTDARWLRIRDATEKALKTPRSKPFKGVLGPELRDEERWQLVEYLKTLWSKSATAHQLSSRARALEPMRYRCAKPVVTSGGTSSNDGT